MLALALRGAIWRRTPHPALVGLSVLVGWSLVLAVVRLAIQYLEAAPAPNFTPYGLNALVASLVVSLAVAAFFVRPVGRATVLAAMAALSVLTEVVLTAIRMGLAPVLPSSPGSAVLSLVPGLSAYVPDHVLQPAFSAVLFLAPVVFWIGAMLAIVRSVEPGPRLRLLGKVIALWGALFVGKALVPHAPAFAGPDFDISSANWWEFARARFAGGRGGHVDPDIAVEHPRSLQSGLMKASVAGLAPQTKGTTDVYAIAIAGWSDQGVFRTEVDGALAVLAQALPIKDRALRLINNPATIETAPLATRRNFAAAVRAIGQVMDKDEDVLLLFLTSHGAADGLALQIPGGGAAVLTPHDVKAVLDAEGIRNRVVIVSSCYGGVFVPPLANDDTIVLTAADAHSTSFGCASDRDWTYFGDALFKQALRPGTDFKRAFTHARILIQGWERMDRIPPSNPQGHFGPALVGKLAPVFKSMDR